MISFQSLRHEMLNRDKIIVIGASTGGPGHLKKIFSRLSPSFNTPVVVAQHMNSVFIPSFVKQFNDELHFNFFLAKSRDIINSSSIYMCETHCEIKRESKDLKLLSCVGVKSHYNPSVEHLFNSAVDVCRECDVLAILLTGIGSDGAQGLSNLQKAGATCIAESKDSAIVFGMPKRAAELNDDIKVMNLQNIINFIERFGDK